MQTPRGCCASVPVSLYKACWVDSQDFLVFLMTSIPSDSNSLSTSSSTVFYELRGEGFDETFHLSICLSANRVDVWSICLSLCDVWLWVPVFVSICNRRKLLLWRTHKAQIYKYNRIPLGHFFTAFFFSFTSCLWFHCHISGLYSLWFLVAKAMLGMGSILWMCVLSHLFLPSQQWLFQ